MAASILPLQPEVDSKSAYMAEQSVIGGCMSNPDRLNRVSLEPKHFTEGPHPRIWETLLALHAEGEPIDNVTVAERMEQAGYEDDISYLSGLVAEYIDGKLEHKARMVYQRSQKIEFWQQVNRAVRNRDESEIVRVAEDIQARLAEGSRRAVQAPVGVAYQSMIDEWADARTRSKVSWGLRDVDKFIKPMQQTRLHVIGARPGMGKTAFALQSALRNAQAGGRGGILSLEQSMEELTARMLCNLSGCPMEWVTGEDTPPPSDVVRIDQAKKTLIDLPIIINDATPMNINQLQGWARSLVHRHGCQLLIVDYIQKIGGDRSKSKTEQVGQVAEGLKNVARIHKIPVIALAQMNRDAQERRPMMSDLKDSGVIEQESDQIMALHRPLNDDGERSRECECVVLKNRHGQSDFVINSIYRGSVFRFEDPDKRYSR